MTFTRPVAVLVALMALMAVWGGYALGNTADSSKADAEAARDKARAEASGEATRAAFLDGRRRGLAAGLSQGRARGRRVGGEKGLTAGAQKATGRQLVSGQSSTPAPSSADTRPSLFPKSGRAPSAHSPQGKRLLKKDPDCQGLPPPPPDYHGPVQC